MASANRTIQLVALNPNGGEDCPQNLVETEYIIHRPPELVKDLAISSLSSELLSQNIIELSSTSNFSPHTLATTQYYDTDFLTQTFTDEDRKLAAALVAVQLSQRANATLASELINSKLNTSTQQISLIQNEKSVTTSIVTNYIPSIEQTQIKTEHAMDLHMQDQNHIANNPTDHCEDGEEEVTLKLYPLRQHAPDSDVEDNMEQIALSASDDAATNGFEAEYDNEIQTSRRILPHKKRIANKLKRSQPLPAARYLHSKSYKCTKCGEQFLSQSSFSEHKLVHNAKNNNFACELCGKVFDNQLNFFEHLKFHYEPEPHIGDPITISEDEMKNIKNESPPEQQIREQEEVTYENEREQEEVTYENEREQEVVTYENEHVAVATEDVNDEETHSPVKSDQRVYNVSSSKSKSNNKNDTKEVRDNNNALQNPITCGICGKVFRRKKAFDCHMSVIHPKKEDIEEFSEPEDMMEGIRHVVNMVPSYDDEERSDEWHPDSKSEFRIVPNMSDSTVSSTIHSVATPRSPCNILEGKPKKQFNCPQCTRTFLHRNSLFYHIRSHTGHRPYQCQTCGKSFYAAGALKIHMRFHSGERPYKCEFCERRFRQWGDLKYHITSLHTDTKMFQCEFCGKDFARKYSLVVHRRIHTGEKNYICEFCTKTFRAASYLQNHRRIHTGEKPHSCEVCKKPFRVRSDLKRHMKTHGEISAATIKSIQVINSPSDDSQLSNSHELIKAGVGISNNNNNSSAEQLKLEENSDSALQEEDEDDPPVTIQEIFVNNNNNNNNNTMTIVSTASSHQSIPLNLHMKPETGEATDITIAPAVCNENIYQAYRQAVNSAERDNNNTLYVWIQTNSDDVLQNA